MGERMSEKEMVNGFYRPSCISYHLSYQERQGKNEIDEWALRGISAYGGLVLKEWGCTEVCIFPKLVHC